MLSRPRSAARDWWWRGIWFKFAIIHWSLTSRRPFVIFLLNWAAHRALSCRLGVAEGTLLTRPWVILNCYTKRRRTDVIRGLDEESRGEVTRPVSLCASWTSSKLEYATKFLRGFFFERDCSARNWALDTLVKGLLNVFNGVVDSAATGILDRPIFSSSSSVCNGHGPPCTLEGPISANVTSGYEERLDRGNVRTSRLVPIKSTAESFEFRLWERVTDPRTSESIKAFNSSSQVMILLNVEFARQFPILAGQLHLGHLHVIPIILMHELIKTSAAHSWIALAESMTALYHREWIHENIWTTLRHEVNANQHVQLKDLRKYDNASNNLSITTTNSLLSRWRLLIQTSSSSKACLLKAWQNELANLAIFSQHSCWIIILAHFWLTELSSIDEVTCVVASRWHSCGISLATIGRKTSND